jgi:hypothetical protein
MRAVSTRSADRDEEPLRETKDDRQQTPDNGRDGVWLRGLVREWRARQTGVEASGDGLGHLEELVAGEHAAGG